MYIIQVFMLCLDIIKSLNTVFSSSLSYKVQITIYLINYINFGAADLGVSAYGRSLYCLSSAL